MSKAEQVVVEVRCRDELLGERLRERLRAHGLKCADGPGPKAGPFPDPDQGHWVVFEWTADAEAALLDAVRKFARKGGVAIALLPADANASVACRLDEVGVAEMIALPENAESIAARVAARVDRMGSHVRWLELPAEGLVMDDLVRDLLDQALERCQGNKSRAAKLLGIHRDQVRYWVKKYGLTQWVRTRSASGKIVPVQAATRS